MSLKAQILIAAMLMSGALFAGVPDSFSPVTNAVFTAFDTETTGFSPKNDRLVEIGAVRFRGDGEILAITNWLINPGMPIPFYATEVHGITSEMVTNAPVFAEVWPAFTAFCKDNILLAHNATFDIGFLRAELDRAGMAQPALSVVDTLPLFRSWFPQAKSYSLEPLSLYLGIPDETYHRAGADSFHLIRIFSAGMRTRQELKLQQLERAAGGIEWLDGGKH
ncbi:MAG: 3'-5' exonuclease [Kiritimatiellales bacterium]|jgi:DNA polymerase III epsilon subunit family exonuclease